MTATVLFHCEHCLKQIGIADHTILVAYEGQSFCMMCRKASGVRCSSQAEERALHAEEILARGEVASLPLVIRCPQCPDVQQGTSVPIERLKQMLESGEDISVIGSACGHVWKLSAVEVQNLRNAVAAGAF